MPNPSTFIQSGVKLVTTAGTQETLAASSTPCNEVVIQALAANIGMVYVGGANIAAGEGVELDAREGLSLDIDDLLKVWVDVEMDGEGVSFVYIGGT